MRFFSRAELIRTCLLVALPAAPPPAFASGGFYQSDDKSWDVTLPSTWRLETTTAPRAEAAHIFHVAARREDGTASLDVTVDFAESGVKKLADLGTVDVVSRRLLSSEAQPVNLVSAAKLPGAGFMAGSTYDITYESASEQRAVKIGLQQGRQVQLIIRSPRTATEEVRAEVSSILGSFKSFPLNAGCLGQSNGIAKSGRGASGERPSPGVCY